MLPEASLAAGFGDEVSEAHGEKGSVPSNDRHIIQALARLTFGPRQRDLERVKKIGLNAFIEEQFNPDNIDDTALAKRLEKLPTLSLSTPVLAEQYNPPKPATALTNLARTPVAPQMKSGSLLDVPVSKTAMETRPSLDAKMGPLGPRPADVPSAPTKNAYMVTNELQRAKLLRAVYSDRQLYEVMVDFWENHFNIFANKDADRWMLTGFDRDSIRPFAMGRFRDLLGATAHSPAMLFYLDNWQSGVVHEYPATKGRPARKTGGINENYARELMELHTLGVNGGYTQKDVQEVARCFTGWTIRKPNEEGIFVYDPAAHDNGEKVVLGVKIPAGGGLADGERVLDILAKNEATAHFVAAKLARRFVADSPPQTVVDRAARVFLSTDGSISATVRSIVTSAEFFSRSAFQTKIKSPFEYVVSALRITNAETDANRPILDWIARMGEPIYGRLTPDGYPDVGQDWLSANDLLARFNFAAALALNSIKGTTVPIAKFAPDSSDPAKIARAAARLLVMVQISDKTLQVLDDLAARTSIRAPGTVPIANTWMSVARDQPNDTMALASEMVSLILGSPEFQHR